MLTRKRFTLSPLAGLALAFLLVGGLTGLHFTAHPAHAQVAPQAADVPGQPPKEVQDLLTALDDLDVMHVLLPLKLTPEQMDKLATAITNAKTDYDKKATALSSAPLLKMADEIRTTRKKAISGTTIPTDFDDRVKAIQKDVSTKRKDIDTQNILSVSAVCKTILTAEQFGICVKLEKDAYKQLKRYNDQATDAQYFNAYIMDVFISNPRIVPLLKEMKVAQTPK